MARSIIRFFCHHKTKKERLKNISCSLVYREKRSLSK
nr:MAG TPA: hypothetical protein [Inoviridae sp.]